MVQISMTMDKHNVNRTKLITYWIIDPEDQKQRLASRHIRKWSKYSAIAALLVALSGLITTAFVWSKYGFMWKEDSSEQSGNNTAILVLHILGPVFLLCGVMCFVISCIIYEFRGKDNYTLTFDPGSIDDV